MGMEVSVEGYRIAASAPFTRTATNQRAAGVPWDVQVIVAGAGGTGAFFAEKVARLLQRLRVHLILCDPDRVEPHNVLRQNYYPGEVGQHKARALAKRLAPWFATGVGERSRLEIVARPFGRATCANWKQPASFRLIVGCVDNPAARRAIWV